MANNRIDVSIEGLEKLLMQFAEMAKFPDEKQMEKELLKRARTLRDQIKQKAPRGKAGSGAFDMGIGSFKFRTGLLKKSIQARKWSARRRIKGAPSVYTAVDRKQAPHAHLVEFGTRWARFPLGSVVYMEGEGKHAVRHYGRRILASKNPKRKKVLHFFIDGKEIFAKNVSRMPANPFFRPTVDKNRARITDGIKKDVEQLIQQISNKKK
jgi:HK97 gp10 family phage protein